MPVDPLPVTSSRFGRPGDIGTASRWESGCCPAVPLRALEATYCTAAAQVSWSLEVGPISQPVVLEPGAGRVFRTPFGTAAVVKVEPGTADFAIFESAPPPGAAQPPHRHRSYDEAFFVIDGEMTFQLSGRSTAAGPGSTVVIPRGCTHGFVNTGQYAARLLVIATPRAVQLIEALGELAGSGPPDPQLIREVFARFDSELLPAESEVVPH